MVSTDRRSIDCSISHDGATALVWRSDAGPLSGHWVTTQGDAAEPGSARNMAVAAWAVLTLGTVAIRAGRLIPWWLFALGLLLVLARHS